MKRRKTNPRRVPISSSDAASMVKRKAIVQAWAIMFTALLDKEGYDAEGLKRVWDAVEDLSDSISKGYVRVDDLIQALKDEANIVLE